jgi:cobalt/nickel transport system permease protein
LHIPDGFLNMPVIAGTYTVSLTWIGLIRKNIRDQFVNQSIPKISLLAAFIFVAQMINVPVTGGTSTHLVGAILALLLAGPYVAVFVMVLVLSLQMLIFQDGGLSAWGANVLNLALVPVTLGYFLLRLSKSWINKKQAPSFLETAFIFLVTWISVQGSAILCSIELALSQLAPLSHILGLMLFINSITGVFEGLLTIIIYRLVKSNRPDIISSTIFTSGNS